MSELPKICLNMIVKNESKIITRLLDSVSILLDYYVIVDTGSTDNTIEVITEFFKNKNIKGKILRKEFENFGTTRSYALDKCVSEPNSDFILLLDADMQVQFKEDFDPQNFKRKLIFDAYYLMQGNDNLVYKNVRFVRNSKRFFYKGATHEFITTNNQYTNGTIAKEIMYINDIGDGGSKGNKFKRDIDLLEKAIKNEPNNIRYLFYLANSYKDDGQYEKAITYYQKRIKSGGWEQEIFCSYYYQGLCYKSLGRMAEAISSWLFGFQFMPSRLETLYAIINFYRTTGNNLLAYHFFKISQDHRNLLEKEEDQLFLSKDIYDYKLDYELTIIAYYAKLNPLEINNLCLYLLNKNIPDDIKNNILFNYKFYSQKLSELKCKSKMQIELLKETGKNLKTEHSYQFHPSTPSICMHNDKLVSVVRYVDYYLNEEGYYKSKNAAGNYDNLKTITTRNVFNIFNINGNKLELEKEFELKYDTQYDGYYKGTEDVRIMSDNENIYFTGNKITKNNPLHIHIEYGIVNLENERSESSLLNIENKNRVEKNWVLFKKGDKNYIIYNWFPLTVCSFDETLFDETLSTYDVDICEKIETSSLFKLVRGSTNGIVIGNEIWFIVHVVSYESKRHYYHMFVTLDLDTFKVKKYSSFFTFDKNRIEYSLGFVYFEKEDKFLIGYSKNDSEPDYMFIKKSDVEPFMQDFS
tara:strand:+ start:144 stop:2228 length:2085 start_codon:yes stop_codon:yes gene_type:complete